MASTKARKAKAPAWRKDRITNVVNADTGRREVDLPNIAGLSTADRDAIFEFEASVIGTVKAVIRMNKRHAGVTPVVTHRLQAAGIPPALAGFYA